jgi:hypothetical protein
MGKIQDVIDWFEEKKENIKDTFGTGVEALNPKGIAEEISGKKK